MGLLPGGNDDQGHHRRGHSLTARSSVQTSEGLYVSNERSPRFVVVVFDVGQAEIVAQGSMTSEVFREQFVDPYALRGERRRPHPDSTVRGGVLATDGATLVTVPIRVWRAAGSAEHWLCQATDDGRAPALSVSALSATDLASAVAARLAGT
jgi:hypothetical protein